MTVLHHVIFAMVNSWSSVSSPENVLRGAHESFVRASQNRKHTCQQAGVSPVSIFFRISGVLSELKSAHNFIQ